MNPHTDDPAVRAVYLGQDIRDSSREGTAVYAVPSAQAPKEDPRAHGGSITPISTITIHPHPAEYGVDDPHPEAPPTPAVPPEEHSAVKEDLKEMQHRWRTCVRWLKETNEVLGATQLELLEARQEIHQLKRRLGE